MTIDLGRELAERWKASGQKGVGVKQVGETQVQIVEPKFARIDGLTLKGEERVQTALTFETGETAGTAELHVRQVDAQGVDLGGAQYLINEKE